MTQSSHRLCPVCGVAFFAGEPVLQCSGCHAVHHPACWIESDGCANPGEHEGQPLPRTFGGVPPPPPASRPAAPPAPPPATAPLPERQPRNRPRNIGSLGLDARGARGPSGLLRFWYVPVGLLIAAAIALGVVKLPVMPNEVQVSDIVLMSMGMHVEAHLGEIEAALDAAGA